MNFITSSQPTPALAGRGRFCARENHLSPGVAELSKTSVLLGSRDRMIAALAEKRTAMTLKMSN
jgi:hypothetical protein